jgi:hypothetical protein
MASEKFSNAGHITLINKKRPLLLAAISVFYPSCAGTQAETKSVRGSQD